MREPSAGRHRFGDPGLVYCRANDEVDDQLTWRSARFLSRFRDESRHTAAAIARGGANPRPAAALNSPG